MSEAVHRDIGTQKGGDNQGLRRASHPCRQSRHAGRRPSLHIAHLRPGSKLAFVAAGHGFTTRPRCAPSRRPLGGVGLRSALGGGGLWTHAAVGLAPAVGGAGGSSPGPGGDGGQGPGGQGGSAGQGPGGGPNVCTNDFDCDDQDFCTTDVCDGGMCVFDLKDADHDGAWTWCAAGPTATTSTPTPIPGSPENCFDADDNDCNGVADCFDPACDGRARLRLPSAARGRAATARTTTATPPSTATTPTASARPRAAAPATEVGLCVNGFDDDCDDGTSTAPTPTAPRRRLQVHGRVRGLQRRRRRRLRPARSTAPTRTARALFPCACAGRRHRPRSATTASTTTATAGRLRRPRLRGLAGVPRRACRRSATTGIDNDCDGHIDCADPTPASSTRAARRRPRSATTASTTTATALIDCDDPDCAAVPICVQQPVELPAPRSSIPGSGTFFGDTTGHANDTEGTCGGGAGEAVFYFVLYQPAACRASTRSARRFDSVLYVRAGDCGQGYELGCDDDSGGFMWSARLDFTLLLPGRLLRVPRRLHHRLRASGPTRGLPAQRRHRSTNPPRSATTASTTTATSTPTAPTRTASTRADCAGCNGGNDPSAEFGVERCTDGQDNDCDGLTDCADDDCSASDYYVTECCNGIDENDNGIPDDFNCRCDNNNDCDCGQICYTTTADLRIAVSDFFGDVCPRGARLVLQPGHQPVRVLRASRVCCFLEALGEATVS